MVCAWSTTNCAQSDYFNVIFAQPVVQHSKQRRMSPAVGAVGFRLLLAICLTTLLFMQQWASFRWYPLVASSGLLTGVSAVRTRRTFAVSTASSVSTCSRVGRYSRVHLLICPGEHASTLFREPVGGVQLFLARFGPRSGALLPYSGTRQRHQAAMAATTPNASSAVPTMEQLQGMAKSASGKGWPSADVRELYISFFEHVKHKRYPSSPVVPHGDNTLLFINAGMNQFKPIFLGQVDKNSPLGKLRRVVDTQKCIRAGGKHNDLEDVGKDEYHHTFFEMLGNWSFGDYFKEEAIEWAWKLLTEVYRLPKDRLYATYFGGDSKCPSCPPDLDAKKFWLKYLPEDRVLPFGAKDNFWEMADVGPCGPCTEIHYDRIGGRNAASLVNMDDPSVLEIWNLVFMQFNRENQQTLTPLPAPCVDTGMGLERLVSVLQGKQSNYDTDLFLPIFERIHSFNPKLSKYDGKVGAADKDKIDTAYRVLADHIRCLTVAITDGAEPSNEGRGYVLRRILRRAIRFAKQTLQLPDGSFPQLAACVCASLGTVFPELLRSQDRVHSVLLKEEQQFTRTLDKGVDRFKKVMSSLPPSGKFPGSEAFTLYTTYGFPLDLTQLMAEEEGREVDAEEFQMKFEEHRLASENIGFKAGGGAAVGRLPPDQHHKLELQGVLPTDDSFKYHWNISQRHYNADSEATPPCACKLQAIWDGTSFAEMAAENGTVVALILDKTPFYAEQGGQLGDEGFLEFNGHHFKVRDTQKSGSYVLHLGTLFGGGALKVGDVLTPHVNYARRLGLAQHHTGTHLLAAALRQALLQKENSKGETGKRSENASVETEKRVIKQKGSLVEEKRLRFDFDWDAPLTNQQIEAVELYVQRAIASSLPVNTAVLPLRTAMELPALCAVFGEAYPDPVRVVTIGPDTKELQKIQETQGADKVSSSVELCGGTHLSNAAQLEDFVVISEESIAKGVRRIVAVAGEAAISARSELRDVCLSLSNLESASPAFPFFEKEVQQAKAFVESNKMIPLLSRRRLLADLENKQKLGLELGKFRAKELLRVGKLSGQEAAAAAAAEGKKFIVLNLEQLQGDGKALDEAAKALQSAAPSLPFLLLTGLESRGSSCICFSPKGSPIVSSQWLNEALKELGGKGGGKERCVGAAKNGTVNGLKRAVDAAVAFAEAALQ